jgi:hypothetical protein
VDHVRGGLTVGGRVEGMLRLRAWPRIAILIQQLRCVPVTTFVSSAVMITFFFTEKFFIWQTAVRCGAIAGDRQWARPRGRTKPGDWRDVGVADDGWDGGHLKCGFVELTTDPCGLSQGRV